MIYQTNIFAKSLKYKIFLFPVKPTNYNMLTLQSGNKDKAKRYSRPTYINIITRSMLQCGDCVMVGFGSHNNKWS